MTLHLPKEHVGAYRHFRRRCLERLAIDMRPHTLWIEACRAIEEPPHDGFTFCIRITRRQRRRLWMTRVDGVPVFIVYDHTAGIPITVLTAPGFVSTEKGLINLERWV